MKRKCHLCPREYQSEKDLVKHYKKIHGLSIANIPKLSEQEKSEFVKECSKILEEMKK